MASTESQVPNMAPTVPRVDIVTFLTISIFVISCFQKHMVYSMGGKTSARAAAAVEPISEMKLSNCGIVIASAPER